VTTRKVPVRKIKIQMGTADQGEKEGRKEEQGRIETEDKLLEGRGSCNKPYI
jgi:hypothetical protein